jgi:phosphopantetheinyl transferase
VTVTLGAESQVIDSGADVWLLAPPFAPELDPFDVRGEVGSVLAHYVHARSLRASRDCNGKPYLPDAAGLHFSISRSSGVTLVAVSSTAELGIDVERRVDRGLRALPAHALCEEEQDTLDRLPESTRSDAFLTYWVRKEAVLKAVGMGLGIEPRLVEVSAPTSDPIVRRLPDILGAPEGWTLADLDVPGCAAALAVRCRAATVRLIGR